NHLATERLSELATAEIEALTNAFSKFPSIRVIRGLKNLRETRRILSIAIGIPRMRINRRKLGQQSCEDKLRSETGVSARGVLATRLNRNSKIEVRDSYCKL